MPRRGRLVLLQGPLDRHGQGCFHISIDPANSMFRVYTTDWPCRSVAHPLGSLHTPRWGETSKPLVQSTSYPLLTAPISDPGGLSALLTSCEAPSTVLLTCLRPHGARPRQRSRKTHEFKQFNAAAVVKTSQILRFRAASQTLADYDSAYLGKLGRGRS